MCLKRAYGYTVYIICMYFEKKNLNDISHITSNRITAILNPKGGGGRGTKFRVYYTQRYTEAKYHQINATFLKIKFWKRLLFISLENHEKATVCEYHNTSGFWPRVRARALRPPVFLGSLTCQTGRCAGAPPPPPPARRPPQQKKNNFV